jgi:heptosyltransferase-2
MKKILILRLSSIGDIVLTQPVAKVLREVYPNATIDYLIKKPYVGIVEAFGCIDTIHTWKNKREILRKLKKQKYDLVIDLHSKLNTFIIKSLVRGKKTITYNKKHYLRKKIVRKITGKSITSTVELYFSALKKIGITQTIEHPALYPDKSKKISLGEKFPGKKLIGIFPGALYATKMYPLKKLVKFIDSVPSRWNCKFIILGSKTEKLLSAELQENTKTELLNLCGEFNISQLISVINNMDVIISNDSGPMHIAAALSKPQIALFGATHPRLGFAPLNKKAVIISSNIYCQPCSLHGSAICPKGHFLCMNSISPELIKKNLGKIIN